MKSKAAIGNHPIHPALVAIPIGAFVLAFIGDIATSTAHTQFWYSFALCCIGIGVLGALFAAIFGFVDYFLVPMTPFVKTLATSHMILNLTAVTLYIISFFLRMNNAAFLTSRWALVMGLAVVALVILAISGWIGGQMAYVHRVGVVENPERTETSTQPAA
jgi:uncharacterized membrane protein